MSFHLAGIVPLVGKPMDFRLEWHDSLMPLAPNFYAVERAVLECAYAGCETIWVIANDDIAPLLRHRLGDYIHDPISIGRKNKYPSQSRKPIPIFYVPCPAKHKNKSHCISWTILHGAKTAYDIGATLSKWVAPGSFYVSFCHGVYPTKVLRPVRRQISRATNFTVETDKSLLWGADLKNEKQFYEENFSLDKVFKHVILYKREQLEVPWFHQIDSWENYCQFLASPEKSQMKHPGKLIISYREFNPVGEDSE